MLVRSTLKEKLIISGGISSLGILGGIVFLALLISQIMKKIAYRLSLKRQTENFKFIKIIFESFKGFKVNV